MKIAFVNLYYQPQGVAGVARSVRYLAEQFVEEGDQAIVICRNRDHVHSRERISGVSVYRIAAQVNPTSASKMATAVISKEHADIVHSFFLRGFDIEELARTVKQAGLPLLHNVQEYYFICQQGLLYRNGQVCHTRCPECQVPRPEVEEYNRLLDGVVSVSRFTLDRHLTSGVFKDLRVRRVIRNPYVTPKVANIMQEKPISGRVRAGFLGRIEPEKGVEWMLRQLAQRSTESWLQLKIAGRSQPAYLNHLIGQYPLRNVQFLGFVEPYEFLQDVDVVLLPSLWFEPESRIIVEANAFGVPVIGSRMGGIPERIRNGVNGFLFDPNKPEALIKILKRFRDEPALRQSMFQACLNEAKRCHPAKIVNEYRVVYRELVSLI